MPTVSKSAGVNTIAMAMAGAAAEEIFHGEYYTNCFKDFDNATEMAKYMVRYSNYLNALT